MFDFLKKYQGGGTVGQFGLTNQFDDNFMMKELLKKLNRYSINVDPRKTFTSQVGDVGSQYMETQMRKLFNLPSKVETDPSMFGTIFGQQFKALTPEFYSPMTQRTQQVEEDKALASMQDIGSSGFHGSGFEEKKKKDIQELYSEGIEAGGLKRDELIAGQYEDIFGQFQSMEDRMANLKWGV